MKTVWLMAVVGAAFKFLNLTFVANWKNSAKLPKIAHSPSPHFVYYECQTASTHVVLLIAKLNSEITDIAMPRADYRFFTRIRKNVGHIEWFWFQSTPNTLNSDFTDSASDRG